MKLAPARLEFVTLIEAAVPTSVAVYDHVPDQVAIPAVIVGWADPWIQPVNMCGAYGVRLDAVAVAGRIEPGAQVDRLEDVVAAIIDAVDGATFALEAATAPFALQIAGVTYLAATVTVSAITQED